MTDKTQPEALRLAEWCDANSAGIYRKSAEAAAELRRQHARIAELEAELEAVGAGGVQALSQKKATPASADKAQAAINSGAGGVQALSAAPAPAIGDELRDTLVAVSAAIAERDDRAAQKMICEILAASTTPPAEQQAEESHIKLLAECRDAFAIPEPGSPLEVQWAAAMARPEEVPEYVRACVAAMQAAPKAEPVKACVCGEPQASGTVHRVDGPCYVAEPQQDAHHLAQALTDPENQPNQYGVEFGMSGQQMHFKIGNQLFRLAYEPDDQQEFEFMKRMLIHAFSTFTPDVKAVPGEQFDSEGFRAWVRQNLPDDTIIGSSEWWADHLTTWAQRFVKAAPQQEAQDSVSPRHPVVMQWRDNAIEACAKIADAYGHEHAAQDMRAMLTAPQQEAQEPCGWDGAEEWEKLAWHLCAEENGEDACNELIWEGGPMPEPWGDRWLKYEGEARRMIDLVRTHVPAPQTTPAPLSDDTKRLAWMADGWTPGHEKLYAKHVLETGGVGDLDDLRTFIDKQIAAQGGKA